MFDPIIAPAAADAVAFNRRIRRLAESSRYQRLERWEKLWHGRQYDDRPSFWTKDLPLNERAPFIVVPIVRGAGRRLIALVLGEGRFPQITVNRASAKLRGVSDAECETLNQFISTLCTAIRARQQFRLAAEHGLACGTDVLVVSMRYGVPRVDILPAKWCTPKRAADGRVCELEIQYRYNETTLNPQSGEEEVQSYWFRRIISETADTTFLPERVDPSGYMPAVWRPDPSKTFAVPFCAVTWHRSMPDVSAQGDIDGTPLGEGLVDEVEALDFAASLGHRNARYNAEPQMVTIGAADIDGPTSKASQPGKAEDAFDRQFTSVNPQIVGEKTPWWKRGVAWAAGKILRKAPGTVWKLPKDGDAKLLESDGSGAEIIATDFARVRSIILDALSVVIADPEKLGTGDLSARALAMMHAPMLAVADALREEWALDMIAPTLEHALRLCASDQVVKSGGVALVGWAEAVPVITKFYDVPSRRFTVPFAFAWGEYFKPGASDIQAYVTAARAGAGEMPVLSRRTAVGMIPGVQDVDAELRMLDGDDGRHTESMRSLLTEPTAPTTIEAPTSADAKSQEEALNGAQIESLQEIVMAVASRQIPRATGIQLITAAFPIDLAKAESIMGETGITFFNAPPVDTDGELGTLQGEHSTLKASHGSTKRMLDHVLAENREGRVVNGSPIAHMAAKKAEDEANGVRPTEPENE